MIPEQHAYRQRLGLAWGIPAGARVLEVGCGQGDMTVALAEAVGPSGRVTAVDIADRSYGAPFTLGEATDAILASPLGSRVEFRFNFDVIERSDLPGEFDYAVLAQSGWYFPSLSALSSVFDRLGSLAARLCFAEWDLAPGSLDQVPHLLAVLIQAQGYALSANDQSNIRTIFTRGQALKLLASSGWRVLREEMVETSGMQDGDWEIKAALAGARSPESGEALAAQIELLRSIAKPSGNMALPAYAIIAER